MNSHFRARPSVIRRDPSSLIGFFRRVIRVTLALVCVACALVLGIALRILGISVIVVTVALVLRWLGLVNFTFPW